MSVTIVQGIFKARSMHAKFQRSMNKEAKNMAFKKISNMKVYEQSGYDNNGYI